MRGITGILATLVALATGLMGGIWLTSSLLQAGHVPGAWRAGPWLIWPRAGAPDADPYTRAFFARRGEIAMAPAEGLALHATGDGSGAAFSARCSYRIAGRMPPARAWTITVYRPDGTLAETAARRSGLTSAEAVGGDMEIRLAAEPAPGNWVPLPPDGRFAVVLRLYDTPLAAIAAGIDADRVPAIERLACR